MWNSKRLISTSQCLNECFHLCFFLSFTKASFMSPILSLRLCFFYLSPQLITLVSLLRFSGSLGHAFRLLLKTVLILAIHLTSLLSLLSSPSRGVRKHFYGTYSKVLQVPSLTSCSQQGALP